MFYRPTKVKIARYGREENHLENPKTLGRSKGWHRRKSLGKSK
jgi:hypothetical protein